MAEKSYVQVQFDGGDTSYTYEDATGQLGIGDTVEVGAEHDEPFTVTVVGTDAPTKDFLGPFTLITRTPLTKGS